MNNVKRIAALILALCLVLCGCGKQETALEGRSFFRGESTAEPTEETDETAAPDMKEEAPEETPEESSEPAAKTDKPATPDKEKNTPEKSFDPDFYFSTTGLDGKSYTEEFFAQHELTMINFWEPWCGPCVGELPELEELYNDYRAQGFAILGVFSTEDGAEAVVSDSGLSFPCIFYVSAFDRFQSGYVPTTVFVDGEGHVVGESYIGAKSYDGWADIVESLL